MVDRRIMKPSSKDEVRRMYEETADSYAEMMDSEIDLPLYSVILERLRERIETLAGPLIDTACGSGHMLSMYHDKYDQHRELVGIDLSPRMVAIASERLGTSARIMAGDMRELMGVDGGSASAVMNYFALHHLDPVGLREALREWHRVLRPGGQLFLATWEGSGAIDYGDESNIVALRYSRDELYTAVQEAGYTVSRCVVEPVEEMEMEAIYLEGAKEQQPDAQ